MSKSYIAAGKRLVYLHTKVSTCVQGSPHLGQRSWPPPLPDPPDPESLLPSLTLFCLRRTVNGITTPLQTGFWDLKQVVAQI